MTGTSVRSDSVMAHMRPSAPEGRHHTTLGTAGQPKNRTVCPGFPLGSPVEGTVRCEIWAAVQNKPHRPRGESERGGGPPLSVGPAGRAARLRSFSASAGAFPANEAVQAHGNLTSAQLSMDGPGPIRLAQREHPGRTVCGTLGGNGRSPQERRGQAHGSGTSRQRCVGCRDGKFLVARGPLVMLRFGGTVGRRRSGRGWPLPGLSQPVAHLCPRGASAPCCAISIHRPTRPCETQRPSQPPARPHPSTACHRRIPGRAMRAKRGDTINTVEDVARSIDRRPGKHQAAMFAGMVAMAQPPDARIMIPRKGLA